MKYGVIIISMELLETTIKDIISACVRVGTTRVALCAIQCDAVNVLENYDRLCADQVWHLGMEGVSHIFPEDGNLDQLKYLRYDNKNYAVAQPQVGDEYLIRCSIQFGHLDVLKWLCVNVPHYDTTPCHLSALYGKLDILKWLREEGYDWNTYILECANLHGFQDIIDWALANGCDDSWLRTLMTYST